MKVGSVIKISLQIEFLNLLRNEEDQTCDWWPDCHGWCCKKYKWFIFKKFSFDQMQIKYSFIVVIVAYLETRVFRRFDYSHNCGYMYPTILNYWLGYCFFNNKYIFYK